MEHAISDPKVARAIRRSRAARAARKSRMRRRVIAAGCASLLLGGALSLSLSGLTAADALYASAQKARSLAEMLGQRSPGERTEAQLTKTKRARALARHRLPILTDRPLKPNAMDLAKILLPPATDVPVSIANPVPMMQVPPTSLASIIVPPGGGAPIVTPPGGSGGGTPGGGSPPLITPPTSPELIPAVPEPGTWAMMLLGFGFIGWRVRREQPAPQLLTA
jgi:hypothetical protein